MLCFSWGGFHFSFCLHIANFTKPSHAQSIQNARRWITEGQVGAETQFHVRWWMIIATVLFWAGIMLWCAR